MTKPEVRARVGEIGIIPAIRVASALDARFAAETLHQAGIPIAEITLTIPGAIELIGELVREFPDMVVGAGTVLDADHAQRCIDAGAMFLTSTGLDLGVVEVAVKSGILVLPGALTPTEIITAWKAGADLVKVFPCSQLGGEHYIRAMKVALPQINLVAAGGVRQHTLAHYIHAGASAVGVGKDLLPNEAIHKRNVTWLQELAHRFVALVRHAREGGESVVTFK
ncbi:MAG: bifunctional 4-hydroxy-2-oxoglutarate aldolase/2-dehydro-3-deoxy-phosphogluconate aldolase [Chloroflexi bacterium]|nr:bifunctional 4-hydroxy-2-oxoglutarate aldolase/2-dehydro-3-deoxy-phosphogluconate aldolase [Chloroflexota bacterium]